MGMHDAETHREPEAGALALGLRREEGLEDVIEYFRSYPAAGVAHARHDRRATALGLLHLRVNGQRPALRHRVRRVAHQIDEHLGELIAITHGVRQLGVEQAPDLDPSLEAHLEEIERALDGLVQADALAPRLSPAGEVEEVAHDPAGA